MKNTTMNKLIALMLLFFGLSGYVVAEDDGAAAPAVSKYYGLKPAFVANFGESGAKKLKFVKAEVSVRASSDAAIGEVMNHDALIRHQIVMLLSRQTENVISSSSGQEAVRIEALEVVQRALKEETGSVQIDDLLFTSFIVQR